MKPIITCFVAVLLVSGCNTAIKPFGDTAAPPDESKPVVPPPVSMSSQSVSASRACDNYTTQVNRAKQSKDLVKLSQLLKKLEKQSDCSQDYLDTLERNISEIATQKASVLVKRGDVNGAKKWLKYAPVSLWTIQTIRGDIAAKGKEWKNAAEFYNQALDLMDSPTATPEPSRADIKKVRSLATETQLLAGQLIAINGRSGKESGAMRGNIRGIEVRERPVPVQFVFGKTALTESGQNSAKKLITFFQRKNPTRITLVGHSDRIGSDIHNCALSRGRALALKDYFVKQGSIDANIITAMGKGKQQPLELYDPSLYTQDEIDQMNRRVEFAIDREVSNTNQCL